MFKKFIHYFKKNKNLIAIEENSKKIKYQDFINFYKKKIKFKNKIVLIFNQNIFDTVFLYSSLIISNNIIILSEYEKNKKNFDLIFSKYNFDILILPKGTFKNFNLKGKKIFKFNQTECYHLENTKKKINYNFENKLLLSTSGSTGSPKMVRLSERNLISNALSICSYLNISKKSIATTTLPISYSYGLSIINSHFVKGGKIIINRFKIIEKQFWKTLNKKKVSSLSFIPYQYDVLKKYNFFNQKLKYIKYMTCAGGMLHLGTINFIREYIKKKISFFIMYGQTEASPRMSYYKLNSKVKSNNCIGQPIKYGKLWISNKNKKGIGEICYRGPNVCLGYANSNKDLIKSDINKSYLKTGDLGFYNSNNKFFYITGRIKRIAKIRGLRISLDDIEAKFNNKNRKINCNFQQNKINIYFENLKNKTIIKKFLVNNLNLSSNDFCFIKKKIINRKKLLAK